MGGLFLVFSVTLAQFILHKTNTLRSLLNGTYTPWATCIGYPFFEIISYVLNAHAMNSLCNKR